MTPTSPTPLNPAPEPTPKATPPNPGFWGGALVSLSLLAPLTALGYLAAQLFALPFLPFSLFDWLARALSGPVITAGIDAMVSVMSAFNLPVADLAKAAEQTIAVVIFSLGFVAAGAVFFALQRPRRAPWRWGPLLALLVGAPLAAVVWRITSSGGSALSPASAGAWALFCVLLWSLLLSATQRRLTLLADDPGAVNAEGDTAVQERRQFMVYLGGSAALITVIVGGGSAASLGMRRAPEEMVDEGVRWSEANALPNANAAVEPVQGTRPEYTNLEQHYRIDINLTPPVVREEEWRLRVEGLVEAPLELSLAELHAFEPVHQFITMACISNTVGGSLTSTTRWTGVPLRRLLEDWGVRDSATHLRISSADGFFEYVALQDVRNDERIMLCYAWDGVPLRIRNGFPLRIYIPDIYGMKQPKWIESIEAVDAWAPGYWVVRGWDETARMQTTSVIDTVATNMMLAETQAGAETDTETGTATGTSTGPMIVPIGGIAHAGARGIRSVEVRVDGGEWRPAELREPMSGLTWVLWRYDWPFEAGEHTLAVRCTDGLGEVQTAEIASPHPSGATGLDGRQVRV